MAGFFPLAYTATIQRRSTERDRSGQVTDTYNTLETVKCLFLATSGNKTTKVREQFDAAMAFYVAPTSQIEEGDRVIDIKGKNGVVIEAGPFEVKSAKKTPGLSGRVHHISCKIVGVG